MNKFQKIAIKIAKDDNKNPHSAYKDMPIYKNAREWYSYIKTEKWTYEKVLDFRKWNKHLRQVG